MQEPSVYSMETHEIVNKLEHIVTGEIPNTQEWQNQSVQDLVVKYKVRLRVQRKNDCGLLQNLCSGSSSSSLMVREL